MRISDWSSDVCSSDLMIGEKVREVQKLWQNIYCLPDLATDGSQWDRLFAAGDRFMLGETQIRVMLSPGHTLASVSYVADERSEEHKSELQSLMRISYAVFCLKKININTHLQILL